MKTRTTITIEIWRSESIRRTAERPAAFCCTCLAEVSTYSLFEAASRLDVDETEVSRRLIAGSMHLAAAEVPIARICGSSF